MGVCDDLLKALRQNLIRDFISVEVELMDGSEDGVGVLWLAGTHQRTLDHAVVDGLVLVVHVIAEALAHPHYLRIVGRKGELRHSHTFGFLLIHAPHGIVVTFANHARHTRLHDTRLLGSNLRKGGAEELGVVERYVGDD